MENKCYLYLPRRPRQLVAFARENETLTLFCGDRTRVLDLSSPKVFIRREGSWETVYYSRKNICVELKADTSLPISIALQSAKKQRREDVLEIDYTPHSWMVYQEDSAAFPPCFV